MSLAMLFGVMIAAMVVIMGFKKMKRSKNKDETATVAPIKNERARFLS